MQILEVNQSPFHVLHYMRAGYDGVEASSLGFIRGVVDRLPGGVDALVATSDLQGREVADAETRPGRLLSYVLIDELRGLASRRLIPPVERVGAILAGDLYAVPTLGRMGGLGDVRDIWRSFAGTFRWVTGVAGNHDMIGNNERHLQELRATEDVHLLDGDACVVGGIRIGGVGGSIGRPGPPYRRDVEIFRSRFLAAVSCPLDLLVVHHAPKVKDQGRKGSVEVRELLEACSAPLCICGHDHWPSPLVTLRNDAQVLNVDHRVVVLTT